MKVTAHGKLESALSGSIDLMDFIGNHIADRAASCGATLGSVPPAVVKRVLALRPTPWHNDVLEISP